MPILAAPAFIILFNVAKSLMPPLALTAMPLEILSFISLISSVVAPPPKKPVEVLTKSALASAASSQALIFSCLVRRYVSMINLRINLKHLRH